MRHNFPLIHKFDLYGDLGCEAATQDATILPILFHDEGLEDPKLVDTHPENPNFATVDYGNCFPDSTIGRIRVKLHLRASPLLFGSGEYASTQYLENIPAYNVRYMPIVTAFSEDLDALDEKSTETIKSVLELQYETTDRQVYPLWSGTDLNSPSTFPNFAASPDTHGSADMPGLSVDGKLESVAWNRDTYYDILNYGTIGKLLRKVTPGGMKQKTLSIRHQFDEVFMNFVPSGVKRINPYTFCGVLLEVPTPVATTLDQPFGPGEMQISNEFQFIAEVYFEEWNKHFNMTKYSTVA